MVGGFPRTLQSFPIISLDFLGKFAHLLNTNSVQIYIAENVDFLNRSLIC